MSKAEKMKPLKKNKWNDDLLFLLDRPSLVSLRLPSVHNDPRLLWLTSITAISFSGLKQIKAERMHAAHPPSSSLTASLPLSSHFAWSHAGFFPTSQKMWCFLYGKGCEAVPVLWYAETWALQWRQTCLCWRVLTGLWKQGWTISSSSSLLFHRAWKEIKTPPGSTYVSTWKALNTVPPHQISQRTRELFQQLKLKVEKKKKKRQTWWQKRGSPAP